MPSATDIARARESGLYTFKIGGSADWCHLSGSLGEHWLNAFMEAFNEAKRKGRIVDEANYLDGKERERRTKEISELRVAIMRIMANGPFSVHDIMLRLEPGPNRDQVRTIIRRLVRVGDGKQRIAKSKSFGRKVQCYVLTKKGRDWLDTIESGRSANG